MISLTDSIKRTISGYSWKEFPNESCGLLINEGPKNEILVFPCRNVSETPEDFFKLNPEDFLRASRLGEVVAVYHSHCSDVGFSQMDKQSSNLHKLPFILFRVASSQFDIWDNENIYKDYINRPFKWGINDCYTLVQDYYLEELGITLGRHVRTESWYQTSPELIEQNIDVEGFIKVDNRFHGFECLRKNDILLFKRPKSKYPSHMAVYLGGKEMLHHARNRFSIVEPFSLRWQKIIHSVIRYKYDSPR